MSCKSSASINAFIACMQAQSCISKSCEGAGPGFKTGCALCQHLGLCACRAIRNSTVARQQPPRLCSQPSRIFSPADLWHPDPAHGVLPLQCLLSTKRSLTDSILKKCWTSTPNEARLVHDHLLFPCLDEKLPYIPSSLDPMVHLAQCFALNA